MKPLLIALCLALPALARSPLPAYTGDRLLVPGGDLGTYASIAETIAELEVGSPQSYYVIVVQSTGGDDWATLTWAEELAAAWRAEAPEAFDRKRSVLVVLATRNRQLAVIGGTHLQDALGMKGERVIDREIVRPYFIPYARKRDYLVGLDRLLHAIEEWIDRRETRLESARIAAAEQRAAERAEMEQRERNFLAETLAYEQAIRADPTLTEAKRQELLDAYRGFTAGFAADPPSDIGARRERLARAETDFLRLKQELTILAANRERALRDLAGLRHDHAALLPTLEKLEAESFPTTPAAAYLATIQAALNLSPADVNADPNGSAELVRGARAAVTSFHRWADEAPRIKQALERDTVPAADRLAAKLQRLARKRSALGLATNALDAVRVRQLEAAGLRDHDVHAARAAYATLAAEQERLATAWDREIASRVFLTRTLPLWILGTAALILAGVLLFLWLRARRWRRRAQTAFEQFNQPVVACLDQLDDFRKRHELLPFTDPDFAAPMTGDTHAFYERLETRQSDLRADWVRLMDLRAEAEALVKTESRWSPAPYRAALDKLAGDHHLAELEAAMKVNEADLAVLEAAHENAERAAATTDEGLARLEQALDAIRCGGLPLAPYEPGRDACADARADAAEAQLGDPIGARAALETTSARLDELLDWTQRVLDQHGQAVRLREALDQARETIRAHRADGLLLSEEEGDPDPVWDQGDAEQREAMTALEGGDDGHAAARVASGQVCVEDALDRVRRQIAARDFCRAELPARRRELERLRALADTAAGHRQRLDEAFHPESFADVAGHIDAARALLAQIPPILDEADRSDDPGTQRYFHAADLLEQTTARQERVAELLGQVTARLEELRALRTDCRTERRRLQAALDQLAESAAGQSRILSRETIDDLGDIERLTADADLAARGDPPHWPRVRHLLRELESEAARVQAAVHSEMLHHRELQADLETAAARDRAVEERLAARNEDRLPANHIHAQAREDLTKLREEARSDQAPWERLRARCADIQERFDRAEALAARDLQLADQARASIREADHRIAQAQHFYSHGISAMTGGAQTARGSAASEFRARNYENAIRVADDAARLARQALATASAEADRIRRRKAAERRARQRAMRRRSRSSFGGTSMSFGASRSSSRSHSSSFRSSSSSRPRSGGSQSSW